MSHEEQHAVRREGQRPSARWRKNLALMLVSTLAALGFAEGVVRLLYGDRMVLFPRYHSKAVYGDYTLRRLRPNTEFWHTSVDGRWKFVINAQGFRDTRDFPYSKKPGRLRVLAIGDSETEGFEARQEFTYSAVVERWLRSRGVDAEAINAGVSGFGTAEAIAFLENEGVKYQPDVVIYGLVANDYLDNVRSGLFSLEHDTLVATNKVYAPAVAILDLINDIPAVRWLSEHSYLYSVLFNTVWDRYKALSMTQAEREARTEYAQPVTTPGDYETALMAALLARLGRFCHERGIFLILIGVPVPEGRDLGGFQSSILPSIRNVAHASADVLLFGDDMLRPYRGAARLYAAHGQRHISEFTHGVFGTHAGDAILNALRACRVSGRQPALCTLGGAPPVARK
jgi:lysophospholipase L1-like esterase